MKARNPGFPRRAKTAFFSWGRSQPGNIAIISALAMPCLVGFCGMGADVGYWYYRQRVVQAAADVTAYDAIVALAGGSTTTTIRSAASSNATSNGWKSSSGTITVNMPPTSGTHKNANSAEVILTETEPRFFSGMFSRRAVQVSGRAVATYSGAGNACMLALNKTAKNAFQFWGHNTTTLTNCNAVSDSLNNQSLSVGGSSTVTAPCLIAAGGVSVTSTLHLTSCATSISHAQYTPDPYAALAAPTIPNPCKNVPNNGNLSPGKYCGGLSIHDTRTLNPGVYIMEGGGFQVSGAATVTGLGTMIYNTSGAFPAGPISITGLGKIITTAPAAGTYQGIGIFQDRAVNQTITVSGVGIGSSIGGTVYAPAAHVDLTGALAVGLDTLGGAYIVDTMTVSGVGNINIDLGNNPPRIPDVNLVE